MNFIFTRIEVKFRWKWNFSTNRQFKGCVKCIHKVRPRILIFISFDSLWSSCFSQTNDSLALSRERKFAYIAGSYPTVLVSGTENDNLFVPFSRLHILNDCHQDTPSIFTIFSLSLHHSFKQFLKRLDFHVREKFAISISIDRVCFKQILLYFFFFILKSWYSV